jgi:hypothetical protein
MASAGDEISFIVHDAGGGIYSSRNFRPDLAAK